MGNLTVRFNSQVNSVLSRTTGFEVVNDVYSLPLSLNLSPGNSAQGLADQQFAADRVLQPSAVDVVNVYSFNGSNDGVGSPLTMALIKGFAISVPVQTNNGTATLAVSAENGAWTGILSGTNVVAEGGFVFFANPGAPAKSGYAPGGGGYSVISTNQLRIQNVSTSLVQYSIWVSGASA